MLYESYDLRYDSGVPPVLPPNNAAFLEQFDSPGNAMNLTQHANCKQHYKAIFLPPAVNIIYKNKGELIDFRLLFVVFWRLASYRWNTPAMVIRSTFPLLW